ncbi:hypothetical protein ERX46_01620 [Brumimicrobium glaciale]|uniref:Phosphoribosyltransferase domain-containing protein n=1 Tax=Brumimicrobium glaciale TaxID=200475 RepID=A0A4Q4KQ77_9FLAO|nr:hypothetical protein [Brumimicrobium glaciale]RYM35718.1 hypothetical protein ERX46_01620 [Brumimicrobium glaciale]
MTQNLHLFELGEKVSDKHIDQIINDFYIAFKNDTGKKNNYEFDFSKLKWISNQELLILTGLFQYLIDVGISFKVNFLIKGSSSNIDKKIARQIIQIWDVWKIYQIVPNNDYNRYFDIDGGFVDRIRKQFNISSSNQEIYDRYGVTPFLSLPKIEKYDDIAISELLNKVYSLSEATNQILESNGCYLPFENKTLNSIITKELYENFLDHFTKSFLNSHKNYSFLSISLKKKLNKDYFEKEKIQSLLKLNFKEENLYDLKPFFFNDFKKEYKNESYLQISFLDFGEGITKTLNESYSNQKEASITDSNILKYAFEPLSSQHTIQERFSENIITPRGLFDVLVIVKRFEGLIVIRSNHGKIAYDFSNNKSIEEAIISFGDETLYFPGSLISIYLPERQLEKKFDSTSIKPNVNFNNFNFNKSSKKTVRLFDIQNQIKSTSSSKSELYNNLFELLLGELNSDKNDSLIYLDFQGYEIDERVAKKIIYFICTDYRFNYQNNIIVLNPPEKFFLENIKDEISELEEVDKKFRFHPTPFVFINELVNELEIFWLGVYSDKDINKLNDLLFDEHDLRSSDFECPEDIIGHINRYDKYGNLYSSINSKEIFKFYKEIQNASIHEEIQSIVESCIQKEESCIYLCNGNYYQYEYLLLNEVLSNEEKLNYLSKNLFLKIQERFGSLEDVLFTGITASSHKILDSLINQDDLKMENCIYLNNYFSFEKEKAFLKLIKHDSKVILLCDVISTGFLVNKFESHLIENNVDLIGIGALVNAIDNDYSGIDYSYIMKKLTSTFNYKLEKKRRSEISELLNQNKIKVIRINPFTNTPITHSIKETNSNESILIDNHEFIKLLDPSEIKIGYFEFNSLIHPYFFDMDTILDKSNPASNKILSALINRLENKINIRDINLIFYPKESGIKNIDFEYFKNNIIPNHSLEFIKLERFQTNEGWRFSHPPKSLIEKCKNKNVLILDDGSCSGESLLQMINEVAFFDVKEITAISIVGRVNDHKREFFSRLKSVQAGGNSVAVNIYFGCHWHLPTYHLSKSPVIDEINWLKTIQSFTNLPLNLKKIIQVVHNELKLKPIKESNNDHIIKSKDNSVIIKDLIITRNELGKLSEFRFYTEYFNYLDHFISQYESKSKKKRGKSPYKDIELICGVLIHEPYLFESLKKIVPDLVDNLKDFIYALFWNENIIDQKLLNYNWDIKNFIHLVFIIFNENEIIKDIGIKKLSILLNKFCIKSSDKNYFFYRILKYLHVSENDKSSKKHSPEFLNLSIELISMIDEDTSHYKAIPSFFASLPNNVADYYFQLNTVINNYKKLHQDSSHNEYIFNDKQVIISSLKVIERNNRLHSDSVEQIKVIRKSWKQISEFIESLLRFSSSFPNYFIFNQDYLLLEEANRSLRTLHGYLSNELYNGDFLNISNIKSLINEVFEEFINEDTNYSNLFSQSKNVNLSSKVKQLISELKSSNEACFFELDIENDVWIEFPTYYFEQIISKEIIGNMRFADLNKPIKISLEIINSSVLLLINNKINFKDKISKGGGKGTDRLERINLFNHNTNYESQTNGDFYLQKITFTKT